jgi:hypothetical protein
VKLSYQLLADEDSNLLEFLTDFVGRGLAKTHNSLLITEILANGTASLTLDGAAAITAAINQRTNVVPYPANGLYWSVTGNLKRLKSK